MNHSFPFRPSWAKRAISGPLQFQKATKAAPPARTSTLPTSHFAQIHMAETAWATSGPSDDSDMSVEEVASLLVGLHALQSAAPGFWRKGSPTLHEPRAPRMTGFEAAPASVDEAEISLPSGTAPRKPRGQRAPKSKQPSKNRIDISASTIEEARPALGRRPYENLRTASLTPAGPPQFLNEHGSKQWIRESSIRQALGNTPDTSSAQSLQHFIGSAPTASPSSEFL